MTGMSKLQAYKVAKTLHWVAFVFICYNLMQGWRIDGGSMGSRENIIMIHSGFGTLAFIMMLVRWWWRRKHNLYTPPGWWRRFSFVIQWAFYPLVLTQVALGVTLASVIDYEVLGLAFIPYSSLAADNKQLADLFLMLHGNLAWLLIGLVLVHGFERWRLMFSNPG